MRVCARARACVRACVRARLCVYVKMSPYVCVCERELFQEFQEFSFSAVTHGKKTFFHFRVIGVEKSVIFSQINPNIYKKRYKRLHPYHLQKYCYSQHIQIHIVIHDIFKCIFSFIVV
jgi:hypothetical protein